MWWFIRKMATQTPNKEEQTQSRLSSKGNWAEEQLLANVPDLSVLSQHDVAVKLWLPEVVAQTLKWVADYEGVSQSSWLREQLMTYTYGKAAVLAYRIRREQVGAHIRFSRKSPDLKSGRWVYKVPQLGKNAVAFKLWMSQQMRTDLALLAGHADLSLSPFLREVVVGELFGRGSLPERAELTGSISAGALAWELDQPVPCMEISESEFNGLGEMVCEWVEDPDA